MRPGLLLELLHLLFVALLGRFRLSGVFLLESRMLGLLLVIIVLENRCGVAEVEFALEPLEFRIRHAPLGFLIEAQPLSVVPHIPSSLDRERKWAAVADSRGKGQRHSSAQFHGFHDALYLSIQPEECGDTFACSVRTQEIADR
jgi:hypothetical protein